MNDDELRDLLATLDDVEPAPPDLTERVWHDVAALLTQPHEPVIAEDATGTVTSMEPRRRSDERSPLRRGAWLAATAGLLIVAVAVGVLNRSAAPPDDAPAVAPPEPRQLVASTLSEACGNFLDATDSAAVFTGGGTQPGEEALRTWVVALTDLIDDVDRLALPSDDSAGRLSLQLLQTALRSAEIAITDGDPAAAATALANAERHRTDIGESGSALSECFPSDG